MSEYSKEDALAFLEALRLTISGRTGFGWLSEKLSALAAYVESITSENERLNAYIDATGSREDFESRFPTTATVEPPPAEDDMPGPSGATGETP